MLYKNVKFIHGGLWRCGDVIICEKSSYFALGGVNFELVRWEKMQIHGNNFLGYIKEIRSWLV